MKKLLVAGVLLGFLASCGGGSSLGLGSSTGSSTGSSASGSSASGSSGSWFGRREEKDVVVTKESIIRDGRHLIASLQEAKFERTKSGGVVRAKGLATRQGYFEAALISTTSFKPDDNGVLTLEFVAKEPPFNTSVSTVRSREIQVGMFLSNQTLAGLKSIRVVARQNQITLRR